MKRFFLPMEKNKVLELFNEGMERLGMRDAVNIKQDEEKVFIRFTKMGTSCFTIVETKVAAGLEFEIAQEDVAFAHRPFRKKIFSELEEIILRYGGRIIG